MFILFRICTLPCILYVCISTIGVPCTWYHVIPSLHVYVYFGPSFFVKSHSRAVTLPIRNQMMTNQCRSLHKMFNVHQIIWFHFNRKPFTKSGKPLSQFCLEVFLVEIGRGNNKLIKHMQIWHV